MHISAPAEADWAAILAVANASAPSKTADNPAWIENRRAFAGRKHHFVARGASNAIVGFAAVEHSGDRRWRVFVVVAPPDLGTVGHALYQRLESALEDETVDALWACEEPADVELIAFLEARGFQSDGTRTLPSGLVVVMLTLSRSAL